MLSRLKLAIFDIDGTLSPQRASSITPFERTLLPNVAPYLAELRRQGVILAVATNQGGIRKQLSTGSVLAHLRWLQQKLDLSAMRFAINSQRKKPSPSMLYELMIQFNVTASETIFVGDRQTDQQAAVAAGVTFVQAKVFFNTPLRTRLQTEEFMSADKQPNNMPTPPSQQRWAALPHSYRATEMAQIADWIAQGESGTILGLAGAGRSTLLNFLCYRPDALQAYLSPQRKTIVLVPVDLNNLPNSRLDTLYRVILRSFFEYRSHFESVHASLIQETYRKHEANRDPFLSQSGLRELLQQLETDGQQTVLLMNRFDRFCQEATPQMTTTLRGLRDSFKDSLSYIVGMRQEIVYLSHLPSLEPVRGILDTFVCWVGPLNQADAQNMLPSGLSQHDVKTLWKLTGGFPSLLRVVGHYWVKERAKETAVLLTKTNIRHRLQALWQGLNQDEQLTLSELQKFGWQTGQDIGNKKKFFEQHQAVLEKLASKGVCRYDNSNWQIVGTLFTAYIALTAGRSRGKLWINEQTQEIYQGKAAIPHLPPQAQAVLEFMLAHPYQPLTQDALIEGAWPADVFKEGVTTDSLYTVIRTIRKTIEPNASEPCYLLTWRRQRSSGYQLFPEGRPQAETS